MAALRWTDEPPTVAGYYWHWDAAEEDGCRTNPSIVTVGPNVADDCKTLIAYSDSSVPPPLSEWGGQWAGPLTPPE